ncbi:MAG: sialidase family protein [candidate division WOR-3 bacterium]
MNKIKKYIIIGIMVTPLIGLEIVWTEDTPISPLDYVSSYLSATNARTIACSDGGRIHVVWHEPQSPYPQDFAIWYRYSDDKGNNWSTTTCISPYSPGMDNYTNTDPTIAVFGQQGVYVIWDGFNSSYTYGWATHLISYDNGQNWEYHGMWVYWGIEPPSGFNSLCSDGNNYLVFYDQQWIPQFGEYRLLGAASVNSGQNWNAPAYWHGYYNDEKPDNMPCTACDSIDRGYLVWEAIDSLNHQIIMFGLTYWGEFPLVPYPGSGSRGAPFIESDLNGNLYVVWSDSRDGNYEIYFKKSPDGGNNWSPDKRLTNANGVSTAPQLAIGREGQIFVVWSDKRDGNFEIYFKYSEDYGETWSEDIRLTDNPASSTKPHITISPDKNSIYIVWNDKRNGDIEEVYFKRGDIATGLKEEKVEKDKIKILMDNFSFLKWNENKIVDITGRITKDKPQKGIYFIIHPHNRIKVIKIEGIK